MKRLISEIAKIPLNEISQADVRQGRCPVCKFNHLDRISGYKICPRCNTKFKLFDGDVFIVQGVE